MSLIVKAIATDYDETLATHGQADEQALAALQECRASGRRVILITGREVASLREAGPKLELFDLVVAENGAVLYFPATGEETALASPPPAELVDQLRRRNVRPVSVGRCIVATLVSQEPAVLGAIHELGLNWNIIHNRESAMALPGGIDKGTGLTAALAELGVSPGNVMGIGDAENDDPFLAMCGTSVAVANALPQLKGKVDFVTQGVCGAGVVEAVERSLASSVITKHS